MGQFCPTCNGRIEQVGTPDSVHDTPVSPFVLGFIGASSELPVSVERDEVLLAGRPIGLPAPGLTGPQRLFFRPHDVEMVDGDAALAGVVVASRRVGGARRVELDVGNTVGHVEIDLPFDHPVVERSRIVFRPKRWTLFPTS